MASKVYVRARSAVLPSGFTEKETLIEIIDGKISNIFTDSQLPAIQDEEGKLTIYDAELVTPGFVDIHTHGVGGHHELLEYWLHPEFTCSKVVKYGTTSVVASVTFPKNNVDNITSVIKALKSRVGVVYPNLAVIDGIHAEGPIVADLGGLVEGKNDMTAEEFEKFIDQMGDACKVVTISPSVEVPHNYSRMKVLQKKNITIALGHDKQTNEEEIMGALRLATPENPIHMTHLFNVQTFHHRDVGLANFGAISGWPKLPQYEGLMEPTIEFVGDLLHLHPLVVQLILKAKNWDKIACVTDAFLEPESADSITYGGRELEVTKKLNCCPKVVLKGTKTMAGSCTTMVAMLNTLVKTFGVPVDKAVYMLSANPARICKLNGVGSIQEKNRADLLFFSKDLELQKTIIAGEVAWEKAPLNSTPGN